MKLKTLFPATSVGSLPHTDAKAAVDLVLSRFREIPAWPQLPKLGFDESMYVQYGENIPGMKIDEAQKKAWIDTTGDNSRELGEFYDKVLGKDVEYFSMSQKYAAGFYEFLSQAGQKKPEGLLYIKGQVIGPISFGLSITDQDKRAILYNEGFADVVVKALAMKARWQVRRLKSIFNDVILFLDEPYLVSIGSSFASLNRQDVINKLDEVISAVHEEGAFCGVHCCGNTDWALLMETGTDIISFDSYDYLDSMALYAQKLKGYIDQERIIAWGAVPTTEAIDLENTDSLFKKFDAGVKLLVKKGIPEDKIKRQCILTPSCGMGSLSMAQAGKCLDTLLELTDRLRK